MIHRPVAVEMSPSMNHTVPVQASRISRNAV